MAWWIFLGKVTSPIDHGITAFISESGPKPVVVKKDPAGPTVLTPRLKFEAPMSVVSHLTRLKQVAPLKAHQIPKEVLVEKKKEPQMPKAAPVVPKSEEKPKESPSDEQVPVVASEKPVVSFGESTGKEKAKVEQEEKKEGGKRFKKRRG